jgi:hypothetical protein
MTAVVVAMIGVFGTMALIPFAIKQAESGLRLDDATNLARNSREAFDAMGYLDHERWAAGHAYNVSGAAPPVNQIDSNVPTRPIMIDNLWVSDNNVGGIGATGLDANVGESRNENILNNYGHFGDGVLQADPDDVNAAGLLIPSSGGTPPTTYPFFGQVHPALPANLRIRRTSLADSGVFPMTSEMASRVFQSSDDLVFSTFGTDDGELAGQPFQVFDRDGLGNILKRQSNVGRISSAMFFLPSQGAYRRVMLVFADRVTTLYQNPGGARNFANANPRALMSSALVTTRTAPYPSGVQSSGGEVVLCENYWDGGGGAPVPDQTRFVNIEGDAETPGVRRNDWVMMINELQAPYGGRTSDELQVQFFRVIGINEGNAPATGNIVDSFNDLSSLSLDGPAFDFGPTATPVPTYIIHLRDVVNVYEDSISL